MGFEKTVVPVSDLEIGMFVSDLDRDWLGTPFLLQGFEISNDDEITQLKQVCSTVFIDTKTLPSGYQPKQAAKRAPDREQEKPKLSNKKSDSEQIKDFEQQVAQAISIEDEVRKLISEIFNQKTKLDLDVVRKVITPMVDSIVENPDAMVYLSHLKNHDDYTYNHSLSSSVWAATLGRKLGLPKEQLTDLTIGSLLCDIGKLDVSESILNKPSTLDEEEFKQIKCHVEYAVERLRNSPGVNDKILETVANHHERESGKGYPNGLDGDSIPLFAKISAIVDCYDAMISKRVHCEAISPNKAIHKLYEFRGVDFQADLIEEFIKALGVYPVGSLVELSDNWVGVIIQANSNQRLKPKLMLLLDHNKNPISPMKIIDLKNRRWDAHRDKKRLAS